MLNFYSCGCTEHGDVSVLSRCEIHNGTIVAATHDKVKKPRSFRTGDLRIRHHPLDSTLATLSEKRIKFDLICSYPEHDSFYAHNSLESGWANKLNPLFPKLHNALTDDGHLLLIVENSLFARTLYDGMMSDLHVNSVSIVSCVDHLFPLHEKWPEFYVYKYAILFSKRDSRIKLPDYMQMSKVHLRLRKLLEPRRVLDISCIHTPFLRIASRTIGVCEDIIRYAKLKRELCQD